jgi:nucleoside-triphosphatase THEP1
MKNSIYIMSEPIHSGKTTTLQQWLRNKDIKAGGILAPDKDGLRQLYDIAKGLYHPFEVDGNHPEADILAIGKYKFARSSFQLAQQILKESVEQDPEWVIVDEIGRLEMDKNEGLEPVISEIIHTYQSGEKKGKLLLVIRNYLLDEAVNMYGLNTDMIVHKSFFE